MKRACSVLFLLSLLLLCSVPTLAHPGRLDENGGHHDRINGGYHYHNGENAGRDRYDSKEYTSKETNYTYTYTIAEKTEEQNNMINEKSIEYDWSILETIIFSFFVAILPSWGIVPLFVMLLDTISNRYFKYSEEYTISMGAVCFVATWVCIIHFFEKKESLGIILFLLVLIIAFIIWFIISKRSNEKGYKKHIEEENKKKEKARLEEIERKKRIEERKRIFNLRRQKYLVYENKTKTEIFNMLFETNIDILFDKMNLPVPRRKQGAFGEYTVYISPSGKKYHYKKGCSGAVNPTSIFLLQQNRYSECGKCACQKKKFKSQDINTQSF